MILVFWIIPSEKPSEARRHPSGCLRLMESPEEKCFDYSNIPVLLSFVVDMLIGFHNGNDDEAVANRLVRRPTVYRFFSGKFNRQF